MAPDKCVVFLVVLTFLWTVNCGGAELCVLRETCILPCKFHSGDEVIIHWIEEPGNTPVHSYYHSQDRLSLQGQRFRGRTSLFKNQIPEGNASLQLTGVDFSDRGRYKCYTSTISGNKESFIDLNVEAPVRKVDIEQVENRITCSSEGIYPEPKLTWSTSPPSTLNPADEPKVYQNEQQLYSISSSLIVAHNATNNLVYSCTVSAGSNKKKATLFQPTSLSGSHAETTIPCTSTNTAWTGLIWMFNHDQIIVNRTRTDLHPITSEGWRQHVKDVSESGNLILQDVSSNHAGIYTCKLSTDEETCVKNTFLEIKESQVSGTSVAGIIGGVVVAVVVAVIVAILLFCFKDKLCNQKKQGKKKTAQKAEAERLKMNEENNIGMEQISEGKQTILTTHSSVDNKETQFVPEESDCET